MIPDDYLNRQYENPPCWCLVVDVYLTELGLEVTDFKTVNSSIRAIAQTFRIALHKGEHGFRQASEPSDYCVVLLGKMSTRTPHHAGVYWQGNVLHATESGVVWQDLASLSDQYQRIEYWTKI